MCARKSTHTQPHTPKKRVIQKDKPVVCQSLHRITTKQKKDFLKDVFLGARQPPPPFLCLGLEFGREDLKIYLVLLWP